MSNAKIQLRLPEDLRDAAMRQAAESGISMNLFVATAVAARVGARAEAARYFTARGSRTTPARAKALLMRLGTPGERRDDDALDVSDDPAAG
jgi:HicB family